MNKFTLIHSTKQIIMHISEVRMQNGIGSLKSTVINNYK